MENRILITADGSHSLYVPELNEHYHSIHGAIQESKHVFLQEGLALFAAAEKVRILEVGFGTGLNVFLTLLYQRSQPQLVEMTSLEAYPITLETAQQLNYCALLGEEDQTPVFEELHSLSWEVWHELQEQFRFRKLQLDLLTDPVPDQYDLIYYDAFGPTAQPDMWTEAIFEKLFACLAPGGVLTTYCAKGQVKRNLKSQGFEVTGRPGPPGKREMTIARKPR